MATRNRNLDKRMNFFDRQFLRAQDLMDEQDYAQDRRQRLVRALHTPGVAEGLAVSAGGSASTISVAAGTAIDGNGRVIVLLSAQSVNLRADATAANVFISFSEAESDPSGDPGITGNTRIRETPTITLQKTAPAPAEQPPPAGVPLATLSLANGQLTPATPTTPNPDNSVRPRAGNVIGDDITARTVKLSGNLTAGGSVGVGTAAPNTLLDVQGAGGQAKGIRIGSPTQQAFLFPGAAAPDAGLLTFGDGTGAKFHIGKASDNGATRFVTFQDNGRMGIGDQTPFATLTLNGSLGFNTAATPMLFMFESGTANADRPVISHSPGNAATGLLYRDRADEMIFQQNGNPAMAVDLAQSRVGIGTATPANPLQIVFNNNDITPASPTVSIENTTGKQSIVSFSFAGTQKSSIRVDNTGTMALNSTTGVFFLNNDFGGSPSLRCSGNLTILGNLVVAGALNVQGPKSGFVVDQFVNRLDGTVEQGDVVVIGANQSSQYLAGDDIPIPEVDLATQAYDTRVCGIVAGVHGELTGAPKEEKSGGKNEKGKEKGSARSRMFEPVELEKLDRTKVTPGQVGQMVTLGAYAHCKVDASFGAIEIGDPLTTSPKKGHAQKATDLTKAAGAIIGKALRPLKKGTGVIPVLVTLR